jgi:hypothetical protein
MLCPLLLLLWDEGGQSNDFQWGEEQRKITFIWDRFYRGTIFHRLFNGCHWFQLGEKGGGGGNRNLKVFPLFSFTSFFQTYISSSNFSKVFISFSPKTLNKFV